MKCIPYFRTEGVFALQRSQECPYLKKVKDMTFRYLNIADFENPSVQKGFIIRPQNWAVFSSLSGVTLAQVKVNRSDD